ncbi:MAG: HAD family phosphatase [Candidatus Binatia bacterium]
MSRRFLLWDHDGVLVDTERWYFEATRAVLQRLQIDLSESQYLEFMAAGRSCWDLARERQLPETRINALRAARDALYQEFLQTKPIEIEGVAEVLAELAPRYRMAIITNARRCDFDLIHARRNLLHHFEFVLTVEDYARCKPQPDPYLAGLARFGAQSTDALVIEDSARGLAAARAAGLDCLIIQNPFTASQDFSGAWRVVDSVRRVPELLVP